MTLPQEAREGLSRAWLEILRLEHPGTTWVLVRDGDRDPEQKQVLAVEGELATAA